MKVKHNIEEYKIIINTIYKGKESVWRKIKLSMVVTVLVEVLNMKFEW